MRDRAKATHLRHTNTRMESRVVKRLGSASRRLWCRGVGLGGLGVRLLCSIPASRNRILITTRLPQVSQKRLEGIAYRLKYKVKHVDPLNQDQLLAEIRKGPVEGMLVILSDTVDKSVLEAAAPHLRVLSTMSVGTNHIDLAAAQERGVRVMSTPGILTAATAELTVSLLLAAARRLPELQAAARGGLWPARWDPTWMLSPGLEGKTVGIVGAGQIGSRVMHCLAPLVGANGHLLYCGPRSKPALAQQWPYDGGAGSVGCGAPQYAGPDVKSLVARCDAVVITCPLTPATFHLFNHEVFSAMRPGCLLVNAARGSVVQESALVKALDAGVVAGAALDVTEKEPMRRNHPLMTRDNVLVLPHMGSATISTRKAMAELALDNLEAGLLGTPCKFEVTE